MQNKEDGVPNPQDISVLVTLYQQGHYAEIEALAATMTTDFPLHSFGWKAMGTALLQQGRTAEALTPLQKASELSLNDVQLHNLLGNTFAKLGQLAEAEASYRQALEINPGFAEAHHNLGNILLLLGRPIEAEISYRRVLEINPSFLEVHHKLGDILLQLGRPAEAETSYRRVLEIKPGFAEAHYKLGNTLLQLGQLSKAETCYRRALELKPDFAEAHSHLAHLLSKQGKSVTAISHYRKSLDISPHLLSAQDGLSNVLSRVVPGWHVPMMNEQKRNQAYFSALKSAITPDTGVLEIGTGSGLLSMMAAKLGAKKVTTCEAEPVIAETAQQIIEDNGYQNSIKVLSKRSNKVIVGDDLTERADILVSEIFSSDLLAEHVIPSIEDAKRRLLKPHARVIPAAGSIMVALFGGKDLMSNLFVENSFEFNLQHFNTIVSRRWEVFRRDLNVEMLTEDVEAFRFDFENDSIFPGESKKLRIPIKSPGCCCGVILWMRLQMDKEIVYENHPLEKSLVSGWQHCVYLFPKPVDVNPGQIAAISASHNRLVPWFSLIGIESA
jgi:type III protein arginine methyltransferase